MKLVAHDRLGKVISQDITRFVLYDDHGNPVACALSYAPGHIHVCHLRDQEFDNVLYLLGVRDDTLVIDIPV